jgi:hypothetical protein
MKRKDNNMFVTFLLAIAFLVLFTWGLSVTKESGWWSAWGSWIGGIGSTAAAERTSGQAWRLE